MQDPGLANVSLIALAPALLGAFLLAMVWHELGHLLVARRLGMPIKLIAFGQGPVLWRRTLAADLRLEWRALPLGMAIGVVGRRTSDGQARRPISHDIAVAAAGPLASFLLTLILVGLAIPAGPATFAGAWLIGTALLSALLAVMNLAPLPGLDGGHLLMLCLALRGWQLPPQRELAVQRLGVRLTAALALISTLALVIKAH